MTNHLIFLFRTVGRRAIDGSSLLQLRHQIVAFRLAIYFTAIGWTIEKGHVAILLTTQIAAQCKDIARIVFVHRYLSIGTDEDHAIAAIACQYHDQTGQRRAL